MPVELLDPDDLADPANDFMRLANRMTDLEANQSRLWDAQNGMQATLDAILAKFQEIGAEVKPVVDALSGNPMFKMFVGKSK